MVGFWTTVRDSRVGWGSVGAIAASVLACCLLALQGVCWNVSWAWEWCFNGGLGRGVIGWAAYQTCDQSCISSGLLITNVNK